VNANVEYRQTDTPVSSLGEKIFLFLELM